MDDNERLIEEAEDEAGLQMLQSGLKLGPLPQHRVSLDNVGKFRLYSSKIKWKVFFAISMFTLGSWLDLAGVWSELPLFVAQLPEGWRLPAILSALTQLAQIGPLALLLGKCFLPNKSNFVVIIYAIFGIGCVSCLLLALTWNKTAYLFHEQRSIYLYIFNFSLSILDGMSSITFLPYIGCHFTKEYILPNYVGESLSSFIPGLLALFQGIDRTDSCLNGTLASNASSASAVAVAAARQRPNYSVSTYFLLMFLLLCVSLTAFTYLNYSKCALGERRKSESQHQYELVNTTLSPRSAGTISLGDADSLEIEVETQLGAKAAHTADNGHFISQKIGEQLSLKQRREIKALMCITFFTSFVNYGYLSSFLSYSTIPYGNTYFYLSINLSNVFLPISIFLSIWSYNLPIKRIFVESFIAFSISFYIVLIGVRSPCPPLANHAWLGGPAIVAAWVLATSLFMRVRCLVATRLEQYGKKNILLTFGIVTLVGQIIGGFIGYVGIEVLRLLKEKPACVENYC